MRERKSKYEAVSTGSPYKNLAFAIITNAVEDYERAHKYIWYYEEHHGKYKSSKYLQAKKDIRDIANFFRSEWFELLSNDIDGEVVLRNLDARLEEERKEW